MFNAADFLSTKQDATLDDRFNALDAGEYTAQIGVADNSLEVKTGEKDGKPWAQMVVQYEVLDPTGEIEKKLGRKPSIKQYFFLDLTPEGKMDQSPQKNVRLGQVLSAAGLNKPGWVPTELKGKMVKIKVAKTKNDIDPANPRSEVVMVGLAN